MEEVFTWLLDADVTPFADNKLGGSERTKPGEPPTTDETGDRLPSGEFQSVAPGGSEQNADNTEVGDWLSSVGRHASGATERAGLSSTKAVALVEVDNFRGYGCKGFLFGRGGGISIAFTEAASPLLDSRTT